MNHEEIICTYENGREKITFKNALKKKKEMNEKIYTVKLFGYVACVLK